jgi:hypothetical protein
MMSEPFTEETIPTRTWQARADLTDAGSTHILAVAVGRTLHIHRAYYVAQVVGSNTAADGIGEIHLGIPGTPDHFSNDCSIPVNCPEGQIVEVVLGANRDIADGEALQLIMDAVTNAPAFAALIVELGEASQTV